MIERLAAGIFKHEHLATVIAKKFQGAHCP